MDSNILNASIVESILKIIPVEGEIEMYKTNSNNLDKAKLASPDLFFIELVKVPNFEARLNALRI